MKSRNITTGIAQVIGDKIGIDWKKINLNDFRKGVMVELEHGLKNPDTNITDDNLIETGKIAKVHLEESPKYYTDLNDNAETNKGEKEYLMAEKPKTFNMLVKDKKIKPMKDEVGECETHEVDHDKHHNKHNVMDVLPKIMGGGLIEMLENLASGGDDIEHIDEDDLDSDDPIVQLFKNLGGKNGVVKIFKINGKDNIKELASRLRGARTAIRANILRHVYSCVQEAMSGNNVANNQRISVKTIDRLIKDASTHQEYEQLNKAKHFILNGNMNSLDVAAIRIKKVFSSYVPSRNIRVAYTTLRTQEGEPYQLCPKMRFQIGYAAPIEISKCREQCIDSKMSVDGKVICAYSDWVKHVADNQNAVNARLEVHKNPDKGIVIGTLAYPQRTINTNGEMNNTFEHMLTEKQKETKDNSTDNIETQLDEVPLYNNKSDDKTVRIQNLKTRTAATMKGINPYCEDGMNYGAQISALTPDGKYADETIEAMLQDNTKGPNDKDLDELMSLTNLLQKSREDTPKQFKVSKLSFNIKSFRKSQISDSEFSDADLDLSTTEGPFCTECKQPCDPKYIDTSFDHEYGTKKEGYWGSDCCEAPVSEDQSGLIEYRHNYERDDDY